MFNNNKILVVIPARDNSKIIPRKNMHLLHNRPVISYAIGVARASQYVDDVVVVTEDSEIALLSEKFGASVIRHSKLDLEDNFSLDALVYDAMIQKEKLTFDEYDIVITLKPNFPLLKTQTLDSCIEKFEDFSIDSVITVVDDRRLDWGYDEKNQRYFPLYMKRVEKELLPKSFKETGAILATRRSFVHEDSRLGTNIDLVELDRVETVDIVDMGGWLIADTYLQKRRIAIVVNAYEEIGTSYIERCLSIASNLIFQDVLFFVDENYPLTSHILSNYDYPYVLYDGVDELFDKLRRYHTNIVINDIMDTSSEYVLKLKEEGYFVVNFEDLGTGSEFADMVFDSLYEHDPSERNVFSGYKYYLLGDEFYFQPPKIITNEVKNVLIIFEGRDSNNLTEKVLNSILATNYNGRINIILGLDYPDKEGFISKIESNPSIQVYTNVSNISEFMFNADIVFTSAGKAMYQICSLGVPTICLIQNERQLTHEFCSEYNGFINMGLGINLDGETISNQFVSLVNDFERRLEMNRKMLTIDLKNGFENLHSAVRENYREFELRK